MPTFRVRVAVVALCLTASLSGCALICREHWKARVWVSSEEPLDLGVSSWTSSDGEGPTLRVQALYSGGETSSAAVELVFVEGEGFILPGNLAQSWMCHGQDDCGADGFTLTFDLLWDASGDTGGGAFQTLTRGCDATEAALWNGWVVIVDCWAEQVVVPCP